MSAFHRAGLAVAASASLLVAAPAGAAPAPRPTGASAEHARIVAHWTPERRAAAIPRELVIDERGYGYLRLPDGALQPYGHAIAAAAGQQPMAKLGGGGDTTGPIVENFDPDGVAIGTSYTFKATVTDNPAGVRSVSFKITKNGSRTQSFSATRTTGDVWQVSLSGFTDGPWSWTVVAKDNANNSTTTPAIPFTVVTSGGGGGGTDVTVNEPWLDPGDLQTAAGRIYFEMPSNARRTRWAGYVCSGTVVKDASGLGRSLILTAAHCVYDDANKAFARYVMFIPDQDTTQASGTDRTCSNDRLGCWTTAFGVVDLDWTTRTFPANVAWDYAFYVVNDAGAHQAGYQTFSNVLDAATTPVSVTDTPPNVDEVTHALGYSYSDDPNFMYCAEAMTTEGADNWWLPSCGLSGGSSGGPWVQPMSDLPNRSGPVISVNSWGYTSEPGMAGPKLNGSSMSCLKSAAEAAAAPPTSDGDAGLTPNGC